VIDVTFRCASHADPCAPCKDCACTQYVGKLQSFSGFIYLFLFFVFLYFFIFKREREACETREFRGEREQSAIFFPKNLSSGIPFALERAGHVPSSKSSALASRMIDTFCDKTARNKSILVVAGFIDGLTFAEGQTSFALTTFVSFAFQTRQVFLGLCLPATCDRASLTSMLRASADRVEREGNSTHRSSGLKVHIVTMKPVPSSNYCAWQDPKFYVLS
jgi:hypothetical protein